MANINKNEIGYNENTRANALMVQYGRRYAAPMDISEVFTSLELAEAYAELDPIAYAGQKISVAGEGLKTEVYKITSGGTLVRLIDADDLASFKLPDNLATTGDVATATATTYSAVTGYVNTKLEDYATYSDVDDILAGLEGGNIDLKGYAKIEDVKMSGDSIYTSAITYTDNAIATAEEKFYWLPIDGETEKHVVKHWRGSRANYEFLAKNNALDIWTRYVVINDNDNSITEYYGSNQINEATGQLLPVISIIGSISEITPNPYDRYLVGSNGNGYQIYECVFDSENTLKWRIKQFDYRYGVRVKDKGLKNYIYVDGELRTYDDVDCGTF